MWDTFFSEKIVKDRQDIKEKNLVPQWTEAWYKTGSMSNAEDYANKFGADSEVVKIIKQRIRQLKMKKGDIMRLKPIHLHKM